MSYGTTTNMTEADKNSIATASLLSTLFSVKLNLLNRDFSLEDLALKNSNLFLKFMCLFARVFNLSL
jgi:hypothetical protein